jgi:photosystem II stability/assembly factor-like uncharacterized protein
MLAIIVSLSFDAAAQTGPWQWSHPSPQGNTVRYIKYWDANNWYALGYVGTFMKTTNAGTTWTFNNLASVNYGASGQKNYVYDAHFFNQSTGIAVGSGSSTAPEYHSGIVRTTNGGTTWDSVTVAPFTTGTFYQVYFTNALTGYAVGTVTPKLFKTTDGGLTWNGNATIGTTTTYDVYSPDSLNIIVSTTVGNITKSTDAGATWTVILTGVSSTLYKMEFKSPLIGFVTGTASKFAYTVDGGLTWTTPTNTGLVAAATFYDLDVKNATVTPSSSKLSQDFESGVVPPTGWTLGLPTPAIWGTYAVSGYGVGTASAKADFYSTSSGFQELISAPLTSASVAGDSLKFDHAYATYSGENDNLDILTSTDAGTTWTLLINYAGGTSGPLNTGGTTTSAFVPTAAQWATKTIALPVGTNKISFRANTAFGNNLYLDNVRIVPLPAPTLTSTVYLTGNSSYIYKTTNSGTTWDTCGFLSPTQPWTSTFYATDLSPYGGDTLLTAGAFGFINRRAGDNHTTYTNVIKPGTIYDVWASSSTGTVITVGASSIAGSVFDQITRSTNGGTTWALVPYSTTSRTAFNCIQMLDNNTGWICGSLGAVYKTSNGGVNWDSVAIDALPGSINFRKIDFVNANTGWVFASAYATGSADSATIFKTTNAGVNWTRQILPQAGTTGSNRGVYGADMLDANTGYLCSYQPRPWHTTNGGSTWLLDSISDGFAGFMYDIKMTGPTTGYIVGSSGRVYKTTNGTIWDTLSIPTRSFSNYALDFLNSNVGYIVGSSGTAFFTTNAGVNWTTVNTQAQSTVWNVFMTPDTKAFGVGANGATFKNNTVLTGIGGSETEIPMTYKLEQNYPNPFNPTTTIKFALPKTGIVSLKIYDITGREMMRLINNQSMNAGYQTQFFNGSMLSSGVYFYSLIVDNNLIDTKKMVLIK